MNFIRGKSFTASDGVFSCNHWARSTRLKATTRKTTFRRVHNTYVTMCVHQLQRPVLYSVAKFMYSINKSLSKTMRNAFGSLRCRSPWETLVKTITSPLRKRFRNNNTHTVMCVHVRARDVPGGDVQRRRDRVIRFWTNTIRYKYCTKTLTILFVLRCSSDYVPIICVLMKSKARAPFSHFAKTSYVCTHARHSLVRGRVYGAISNGFLRRIFA